MAYFIHNNKVFTVDVYDKNTDEFIDERVTQKYKHNSRGVKKVPIRHTNVCKPFSRVVWNIFKNPNHNLTLGLFQNKKVVGVAGFDFKTDGKKLKVVVLDAFCLHEKFRGKGISDLFLQIAIVLAKAMANTNNVLLYASTMGKKFYQRNGFEKLKGRQFAIWADALYLGLSIAKTGRGQGYAAEFYGGMKLNNKKFEKAIRENEKSIHVI